MAAKGQSTRDKFFLDFVNTATQTADPFGKERQTKSASNVDWLPDLFFVEADVRNVVASEQVSAESRAAYQQSTSFNVEDRIGQIPEAVQASVQPDFRAAG